MFPVQAFLSFFAWNPAAVAFPAHLSEPDGNIGAGPQLVVQFNAGFGQRSPGMVNVAVADGPLSFLVVWRRVMAECAVHQPVEIGICTACSAFGSVFCRIDGPGAKTVSIVQLAEVAPDQLLDRFRTRASRHSNGISLGRQARDAVVRTVACG